MRATSSAVAAVERRLAAAGCVAAAEEAAELAAAAPDEAILDAWTARREQGEPPAWITGSTVFCGRSLHVAPNVYVPRPQTEELARRAAALLAVGGRALDLCCGAGAIAAHLLAVVGGATVVGVDVDVRAANCARGNGVEVVVGDVGALPFASVSAGGFDVVTAVAPYVPTGQLRLLPADVQRYEPRAALDGGADGLDLVRSVVAAAGRLLRAGGWLLLEIGGDQDVAVAPALAGGGFGAGVAWRDDEGDLRGVAAQRQPRDGRSA